jgi:hypothetical protein
MYMFFANVLDNIAARLTGPMSFRFIVQPVIAIILGIRDGITDAKAGTPPFIYDLIFKPEDRKESLKGVLKRLRVPVIIGTVFDAIAQYLIFKSIRPLPAILVGVTVIGIPYTLARGLTNRIASFKKR